MAFDMSQFYQVFFEETAEHLESMESLLLDLDRDNPDPEQLNAIFRAAHSIKGSSGTFGFTDMADVTHVLETLLDRIRKGEVDITEDMVDAFLTAGDALKVLLAAHRGEGEAAPDLVAAACARLRSLTENPGHTEPEPSTVPRALAEGDNQPDLQVWDVGFTPAQDCGGEVLDNLKRELGRLGQVVALPINGNMSDDSRRLLRVVGACGAEEIHALLDFVAEEDSISILPGVMDDDREGSYGFLVGDPGEVPILSDLPPDLVSAPGSEAAAYGFFDDGNEETAYGLFEPERVNEETAYGLFEPEVQAQAQATSNEAYGFFDPPTAVNAGVAAEVKETAYGLFELPNQPAESNPTATESPTTPDAGEGADAADGSYGFFQAVPVKPAAAKESLRPVTQSVTAAGENAGGASAKVTALVTAGRSKAEERSARTAPPKPAAADTSIRVSVEKVDQMINLVGELVITQAMLAQSASGLDPAQYERLLNGLAQLERNTRDLQESVMSIRMMPISVVFSRFPRVVRDLSQKLGKQVELKTSGESTELDKGLIERISDPLTHLIRNSLDHGIELPEARVAAGKPAMGTITLKASHQSGNIVIEVGDDGAGLSREKILDKARSRGLPVSDTMSDQEVWQLIFEAGFSTAEQVTEVSGRGVGMDVVKRNIGAMGGRVDIESLTDVGTRMTVRLPLTLAILDGMSVAVGEETYIIPLNYVMESLQPRQAMLKTVSGVHRLIQVRSEYLPVIALHEHFNIAGFEENVENAIMVVLEADGIKAALLVDALVGQHQVVIKSLEANYRKVSGISGATIMGDGRVALILDVAALVATARGSLAAA